MFLKSQIKHIAHFSYIDMSLLSAHHSSVIFLYALSPFFSYSKICHLIFKAAECTAAFQAKAKLTGNFGIAAGISKLFHYRIFVNIILSRQCDIFYRSYPLSRQAVSYHYPFTRTPRQSRRFPYYNKQCFRYLSFQVLLEFYQLY